MILGKPNDQHKVKQFKILEKILGARRFALFPQPLADGQWVWLQHYYEHYDFWWRPDSFRLPSRAGDTYVPSVTNYLERQSVAQCVFLHQSKAVSLQSFWLLILSWCSTQLNLLLQCLFVSAVSDSTPLVRCHRLACGLLPRRAAEKPWYRTC